MKNEILNDIIEKIEPYLKNVRTLDLDCYPDMLLYSVTDFIDEAKKITCAKSSNATKPKENTRRRNGASTYTSKKGLANLILNSNNPVIEKLRFIWLAESVLPSLAHYQSYPPEQKDEEGYIILEEVPGSKAYDKRVEYAYRKGLNEGS